MTNNRLRHILFFLSCLAVYTIHAQTPEVDSLKVVLETTQNERDKAKIAIQLSKLHERIDIEKSKMYAGQALAFQDDSIKSEAYNQLGRAFFYSNQLDSAANHFQTSISFLDSLGYDDQAASVSISLGAVQLRKGSYKEAVSTLIKGASFFEAVNDSTNMAKCYSNVSTAFGELGETAKAIEYGEKALFIFKAQGLIPYQAVTLPNLAGEFLKLGDTTKAKSYFLEAEALAQQRNDKFSLARIYNNLGNMYLETDYEQSEGYLIQALDLRKETKNNDGIGTLYNNLGYLQLKKENYKSAITYLQNALDFGTGTNLAITYNNLSDAHKKIGNYRAALDFSEKKNSLNDSLLQVENQKAIAEISTNTRPKKKKRKFSTYKT